MIVTRPFVLLAGIFGVCMLLLAGMPAPAGVIRCGRSSG